ncbi:MAG: response regulator transcription factor [Acidobacteria bacterium]|nr:response regulator transcription factor [Acidobacteriota bacterium]
MRQVGFNAPDVVVLDVRLPGGSAVEATRKVRQRFPDVAVLILSSFADEEALTSSIEVGAAGYLLKRIDTEAIVDAVRSGHEDRRTRPRDRCVHQNHPLLRDHRRSPRR